MSETQIHTYKVISLDVWGHGPDEHEKYDCKPDKYGEYLCDGYTVNDAHYTGRTIEVSAEKKVYNAGTPYEFFSYESSDADIIRACIEAGMLTPACAEKDAVKIDGESDYTLYLEDAESGMPLIHLERAKEANFTSVCKSRVNDG